MKIRVAGIEITKWTNLTLNTRFDTIKSVFSVDMYWNPYDKAMRLIMLPGGYNEVTVVSDEGIVVFTGVFINPSFKSGSKPCTVNLTGYSLTGVLDDVEFSAVFDTTQTNGKTFFQICQTVCNKMGLAVVDNTQGVASKIITTGSVSRSAGQPQSDETVERSDPDRGQSIADYLADLARGLNIVLSHDQYGRLVLNYDIGTGGPLFNFTQGMPGVEYELSVDGAQMHSTITAAAQGDYTGGVADPKTVINPYVAPQGKYNFRNAAMNGDINGKIDRRINAIGNVADDGQLQVLNEFNTGYRPHSVTQTDTDAPNLQDVANQALADELTAVKLTILINRWSFNGKRIPVGSIVSVQNPELYLFNKANFFVYGIDYEGDEEKTTATLNCTLPEAFNGVVPTKSIFYKPNSDNFVPEDETVVNRGNLRPESFDIIPAPNL